MQDKLEKTQYGGHQVQFWFIMITTTSQLLAQVKSQDRQVLLEGGVKLVTSIKRCCVRN
jgi:hypothetical protein